MKNYAAIDVGSNSFHLKIASEQKDRISSTFLDKRVVHRLAAKDSAGNIYIPEERIIKGIEILNEFNKDIENYNATYFGVATSAVRESANGNEFLTRVKAKTGLSIEKIPGQREAELIYEGALLFLQEEQKEVTVIDIGGGSTEIIKGRGKEFLFAESMKVGAVRCSQMFAPDFTYSDDAFSQITEYTIEQLMLHFPVKEQYQSPVVIGTSGTFNSLSALRGFLTPDAQCLSYELIQKVEFLCHEYNELNRRLSLPYIEKNKLEILPASIMIVRSIADYFGFNEFKYSPYAIREGMIQELIRKDKAGG